MKTIIKFLFISSLIALNACSKEDPIPDVVSVIANKWWCDSNNVASSQYFKSDGTWEQGIKNGGADNDKGNWTLSIDKKKIIITNVVGKNQTLKNWEYELISSSSTNLQLRFAAFNLQMPMVVCP
jgi:major membrane immunogen (membrane-anchored lipoprotein)